MDTTYTAHGKWQKSKSILKLSPQKEKKLGRLKKANWDHNIPQNLKCARLVKHLFNWRILH